MADNIQRFGADTSDYIAKIKQVIVQLKDQKVAVEDIALSLVKMNREHEVTSAKFKITSESGTELTGVLKSVKEGTKGAVEGYKIYNQELRNVDEAQKKVKTSKPDLSAGTATVSKFLTGANIVAPEDLGQLSRFQTIQKRLAETVAKDSNLGPALQEIFDKLNKGVIDVEAGLRGKVQAELIKLLKIQEQITEETRKQNVNTTPRVTPEQRRAQRAEQEAVGTSVRSFALERLPIVSGASTGSIVNFQAALTRLAQTAANTKIPLEQLQVLFTQLRSNPAGDFSNRNAELLKVQTSIQQVIASYEAMQKSATANSIETEKGFGRIFLSVQSLLRVLEVQVIHRFFGAFLTNVQNSIAQAAELNVKIGEILTIAQKSGVTARELTQTTRQLSEQFARPQVDVAEAAYQAFSNQVIRTRNDVNFLDEALRFSRVTVSSATESVNLLSSALNAFHIPVSETRRVADTLFRTIEIGRLRVRDFDNTFGRVAVTAGQVGITVEETAAFIALVTRNGVPANEAMTQLNSIIQALIKPSSELQQLFRELGFSSIQQAVETERLSGIFRILDNELQRGGNRIGELITNVRAVRGVFGTTGRGLEEYNETLREVSTNSAEYTARAARIMEENLGTRFRAELIKVQNFFTNDFGQGFLEAVLKLTEPFGGLSGIVKQLGETFKLFVVPILEIGKGWSQIITVGGNLTKGLQTLIITWGSYKIAQTAINIASATYTTIVDALNVRESLRAQVLQQHTLAQIRFVQGNEAYILALEKSRLAQERLAISSKALGTALASIGLFAVPILIQAFDRQIIEFLRPIEKFVRESEEIERKTKEINERFTTQQRERDTQATQAFREEVNERLSVYQNSLRDINQVLNRFVEQQRNRFKEVNTDLRQYAGTITAAIGKIVSDLSSKITESETQIRQSVTNIARFRDRDTSRFFSETLRVASSNTSGLDINRVTDTQVSLIRDRVTTLQREINALVLQGDKDAIESARRKFEEIRNLTTQRFNLETERRRTLVEEGRLTADENIVHPVTGRSVPVVRADLAGLRRELDLLTNQERTAEQVFQQAQQRSIQINQEILNFERRRQKAIQDAVKDLTDFNLLNQQGQLRREFQGDRGPATARAQFEEVVNRVRGAIEPLRVSEQEYQRLVRTFGSEQANLIRQRIQNAELEGRDINALNESIGRSRVAIEEQIQREITAVRSQALSQRITEERNQLIRAREQAIRDRQEAQQQQGTAIEQAQGNVRFFAEAVANAPLLRNGADPRGARRLQELIPQLAEATQRQLLQFAQTRSEEDRQRAEDLLRNFTENVKAFVRSNFRPDQRLSEVFRGAPPITPGEFSQRNLSTGDSADTLNSTASRIRAANQVISQTDLELRNVNTQIARLPENLRVLIGVGDQIAAAMERALGGTADRINRIALEIGRLVDTLNRLQRQNPLGVQGGVSFQTEEFAEGGLIGNRFNSLGRDNTIIAARTGEFVVNPAATQRYFPQLLAMNNLKHYESGGIVSNTTVGDVTIHVEGNKSPEQTARIVMSKFKRELRRGTGGF